MALVGGQPTPVQTERRGASTVLKVAGAEFEIGALDKDGKPMSLGADGVIQATTAGVLRARADGLVEGSTAQIWILPPPTKVDEVVVGSSGFVEYSYELQNSKSGNQRLVIMGATDSADELTVAIPYFVSTTDSGWPIQLIVVIFVVLLGALVIPATIARRRRTL